MRTARRQPRSERSAVPLVGAAIAAIVAIVAIVPIGLSSGCAGGRVNLPHGTPAIGTRYGASAGGIRVGLGFDPRERRGRTPFDTDIEGPLGPGANSRARQREAAREQALEAELEAATAKDSDRAKARTPASTPTRKEPGAPIPTMAPAVKPDPRATPRVIEYRLPGHGGDRPSRP